MSSLYELKDNYLKLSEMLYEVEVDEQCILDTLESIEGEIEDKADNYAKIIFNLLGDAATIKIEKLRLESRQKAYENRAKVLKDRLEEMMNATGKTKFKTALFNFGIQKNGGLAPLWLIEDINLIPFGYLKHEPDNTKIRNLLEIQSVSWAKIEERGESLRIK